MKLYDSMKGLQFHDKLMEGLHQAVARVFEGLRGCHGSRSHCFLGRVRLTGPSAVVLNLRSVTCWPWLEDVALLFL
jgi:hypothetical protein